MRFKSIFCVFLFINFLGCKEPYDPSTEARISNYLVVDGFINMAGVSTFKLTRTLKLAESGLIKNELKAILQIEGENGSSYKLNETSNGLYESSALSLPLSSKYRLRIKTADGKEYLSGFEAGKITPPMDLEMERSSEGLSFFVNTKDPGRNTNYYQWRHLETWEIQSIRYSEWRVISSPTVRAIRRDPAESDLMYTCWATVPSGNVMTASTVKLSEDRVDKFPLVFIPTGSEKIAIRYSLLAQQFAISKEAFEFFEFMKKASEQMGSVFDPLPSTIRGNIRCINDADEIVIGYVAAASAVEKRVFLSNKDLPDWKYIAGCEEIWIPNNSFNLSRFALSEGRLLTWGDPNPFIPDPDIIVRFYGSPAKCVDCRLKGGVAVKPAYW